MTATLNQLLAMQSTALLIYERMKLKSETKLRDSATRARLCVVVVHHSRRNNREQVVKETLGHVSCQLPVGCMLHCRDFFNLFSINVQQYTLENALTLTEQSRLQKFVSFVPG